MKQFIFFLMAILGFSACEEGGRGGHESMVEYGCPHADFRFSARVVDEQGNPIKGIEARDRYGNFIFESDSSISDENGVIDFSARVFSVESDVCFVDPDGEENGGEFETLKVDISDKLIQTEEGESWYQGGFEAELGDVVDAKGRG